MHQLYLLDGMALVYRAHFALIRNPILTSQGLNTSAILGFTNVLLDLIDNHKATHIGVAFDTKEPTPRHILYPEYKAQRDAMPEELATAIPYVKELCRAMGIPVLEVPGYEADDIIGTLAHRADLEGGIHTYMVTPDKDFAQLVTNTTTMWKPGRQGGNHELLDPAAICHQWEIESPNQVIDILGLWGDASDNIPGVPGIGEKTAKKLIKQFGSMENILDSTHELKGKQKENLEKFRDQALLSKKLVTIMLDAPVDVTWESLKLSDRDTEALTTLLTKLEFNSLGRRILGDDFVAGRGHQSISENTSSGNKTSAPDADTSTPPPPAVLKSINDVPHQYYLVDNVQALDSLCKKLSLSQRFCFDLETTGLDPRSCEILGIAFSTTPHEAYYVHTGTNSALSVSMVLEKLRPIFSTRLEKMGHNLKYDLSVLLAHDYPVSGPFFDTMIVHSMVYPDQKHGMDIVAESLLGYSPVKLTDLPETTPEPEADLFSGLSSTGDNPEKAKKPTKKGKKKDLNMRMIDVAALSDYAAEDADITLQLADLLRPALESAKQSDTYNNIEAPLLPVLTAMENEGIAIDIQSLKNTSDHLARQIASLNESITAAAGHSFNLNSPKQLGEVLFGEMQLLEKPKKTKTGQYKTDEQTLTALASKHEIVAHILEYREASKLKSTYVDALPTHVSPKTNRVHTHYHQLLTSTGRLSSNNPNLQNIPIRTEAGREVRKAFIPRDQNHILLAADYSQVELRVMAALSGDEAMIEAIKADLDIHSATAARVYGVSIDDVTKEQRRNAKMVNFGIIYGISAFGLAQRLDIGRAEAKEIIDTYFQQYPGVKTYMETTVEFAKEHGYIETITGRKCSIRNIGSRNAMIAKGAERAAINAPVQGSAADMIKLAMIKVRQLLDSEQAKTKMLLQVHDELLFDLHRSEESSLVPKIVHAMEHALPLPHDIPCRVDTGTGSNWLEAH